MTVSAPIAGILNKSYFDVGEYVFKVAAAKQLDRSFKHTMGRVAYHLPCHLKALRTSRTLLKLFEQIPDLEVVPIEKGCSGMAGTFGLTRGNFETSLAIGHDLIRQELHGEEVAS